MIFLLPLICLLLFIFLIWKMKFFAFPGLSKMQLAGLFLIKIAGGAAVWLVYTYYYPGSDFHLYFSDSKIISDRFFSPDNDNIIRSWNSNFDDAFFNNSRVVIFINVLLQFISFNNIFVHIIFFCFFSFVGLTALYKAFWNHFAGKKYALVIGIYLVPSVLFWTAGIYKETIAMLCLGLLIYITDFGLRQIYSTKQIVFTVLLFFALFFIKIYVAAAVFPVLIVNFIAGRTTREKLWLKYILVFVPFILMIHGASMISDRTSIYRLIADKQAKTISEAEGGIFIVNNRNFIRLNYEDKNALLMQPDSSYRIKRGSNYLSWKLDNMQDTSFVNNSNDTSNFNIFYTVVPANAVLNTERLDPSFISILKNIPSAILNVLIQPTLLNINNLMQLFSAVENLWLLLLIFLAIIFFDKNIIRQKEIFLFCMVFTLIQFTAIGLTTSAVGAMVRYKVTALLFLVTICLQCINFPAIGKLLNRSKDQDFYTK